MTFISLNLADQSLESKIKRATDELVKVVLGNSTDKLAFLGDLSHKDLKAIIQRVVNNTDLSKYPLQIMFMQMPMQ